MNNRSLVLLAAVICLLTACGNEGQPTPPPPPPPPPDFGAIDKYLACSAKPRRPLSTREQCEIDAFRARCTELDDCYVSCISSPDGHLGGGRCAHICTFGLHAGAPYPPGLAACDVLPGASGIDVESARHGAPERGNPEVFDPPAVAAEADAWQPGAKWRFTETDKEGRVRTRVFRVQGRLERDSCMVGHWRKLKLIEGDAKGLNAPAWKRDGQFVTLLLSSSVCDAYVSYDGKLEGTKFTGKYVASGLRGERELGVVEGVAVP